MGPREFQRLTSTAGVTPTQYGRFSAGVRCRKLTLAHGRGIIGLLSGTKMTINKFAWRGGALFAAAMFAGFVTPAGAATERVLYTFKGGSDGSFPNGLTVVGRTLYGTAPGYLGAQGYGTVFSIRPNGDFSVLYAFAGGGDGAFPEGNLLYVKDALFGTTEAGGSYGEGTVFSVTPSGSETVLHSFGGDDDGAYPANAGLLYIEDRIYGTTTAGGANCLGNNFGCGTVFSLKPGNGAESVLYSFLGTDGYAPSGRMEHIGSTIYGTTAEGGASKSYDGTVYSLTLDGTEAVLHSFTGGSDGAEPVGGLTSLNGTLYGTASLGGKGYGTLFSITPSGTFTVLYTFTGGADGGLPYGWLEKVKDKLYGTTVEGGAGKSGTVYSVTTGGAFKVLYAFKGGSDGANPEAGPTHIVNNLYGTTYDGGSSACDGNGCGTVFLIKP